MTYTYNDVQNSKTVYALGDEASETTDDMDFAKWAALQQAYMPNLVTAGAQQAASHVHSVSQAQTRLSTAQSVANVHLMSDSFIRDSITGK